MSSIHGFSLQAFGTTVQATTTCDDAYAVLERYIFPSLPRAIGAFADADLSIRIDRVADQIQLFANDVHTASASQAISLVPDIIRTLDDAVIPRLKTLRAVHAGTVVWDGKALLLPGVSHAGKSSLVAELLRRGATYFSDEYALIDAKGRVHPYPRPLLVRNGCPEQVPMLAAQYKAPVGNAPAQVGWILALQYLPACTWTVAPISQSEALLTLLRNTPHVLAESPDMVNMFQCAVAGVACYAGHRNEAAHAVDQIMQLVGITA